MNRPTRKSLVVGLAGLLLIIAGSTAQAGWLFVLAAIVLGLVIASLLTRHHLDDAEVHRTVARRVRVGDEARLLYELRDEGGRPLPLMQMQDRSAPFGPLTFVAERVEAGGAVALETVGVASSRGEYEGCEIELKSGAPFGLARRKRLLSISSPITVVPSWVELTTFPLLEPSSYPFESLHERARMGASEEYLGVREYRPGDPPRTVHWRSTARIGQLIVREFQEEAASRVAVVVGGLDTGDPPDSAFEAVVSAAASVGRYSLVTGHPVELARPVDDGSIARLGDADRASLLDWLAAARPNDSSLDEAVVAALGRTGRRGTMILCISASGKAAAGIDSAISLIQSAGARAIAVIARSSSWSGSASDEENDMIARVSKRAPTKVLARGEDLKACLQAS